MSFSLVFLLNRFFYRIYDFIRNWYVGGFIWFARNTFNFLESLDRIFAVRITFRYWLKPLYQDYSIIGYILGFFLRTGRLLVGGLVHLFFLAIAIALYLIWAAIPIFIIYKGFSHG